MLALATFLPAGVSQKDVFDDKLLGKLNTLSDKLDGLSPEEVYKQNYVKVIDTDGSGKIDEDELYTHALALGIIDEGDRSAKQELTAVFNAITKFRETGTPHAEAEQQLAQLWNVTIPTYEGVHEEFSAFKKLVGGALNIGKGLADTASAYFTTPAKKTQPSAPPPPLRLGRDGKFKILHLTDFHMGEQNGWQGTSGAWQDTLTMSAFSRYFDAEKPSLAVLGGDMLTGLNLEPSKGEQKFYWDKMISKIDSYGVPHSAVIGNHDDEPYDHKTPQRWNRRSMLGYDATLSKSYSKVVPDMGAGHSGSNVLDVLDSSGNTPVMHIAHLDTGGGSIGQGLNAADINFLKAEMRTRTKPTVLFVHIPISQGFRKGGYGQIVMPNTAKCIGEKAEDKEPGWSSLLDNALKGLPQIKAVIVGHQHCQNFCCEKQMGGHTVNFCYGRHSGAGGYGCSTRGGSFTGKLLGAFKAENFGSRVITFDKATGKFSSHTRLMDNSVINEQPLP